MSNINDRLGKAFFDHEDVVGISRSLLGKVLCSDQPDGYTEGIIVETEAYRAPEDKASHAHGMRRTARTEVMFGEAGIAYVYLCYGIHHLFNIVTGPVDTPHAILIRAVEPIAGIDLMKARRKMATTSYRLTSGPGSMSRAMGFHKDQTGSDICNNSSKIWVEDRGSNITHKEIIESPRVGVGYAEEWANKPWRFRIQNNRWTSPAK